MDPALATLLGLGLALALVATVLGALAWARRDARGQEARAGAAELALERGRRERAEERATAAEQALAELGRRAIERQRGAQLDADAEAETQRVLASAPGDPTGAALALVRLLRAREAGGDPADPAPGSGGRPAGDMG